MILFATIAAFAAYVVVTRIPDWKDGLTINAAAVKVSPGSARSHTFYVTGLYDNKYRALKKYGGEKTFGNGNGIPHQ